MAHNQPESPGSTDTKETASGPTYLFALRDDDAIGADTVFYLASTVDLARSVGQRVADNSGSNSGWRVALVTKASVAQVSQIQLDEAIESLDVYDDPDPGVYDPEPSPGTLQRAAFKRAAASWEALLTPDNETPEKESPKPSASVIADTALLAMILRDALFVQLDYPDAGSSPQHIALITNVRERIARLLDRSGMARLKCLAAVGVHVKDPPEPVRWGMFAGAVAMCHPDFGGEVKGPLSDADLPAAMERIMRLCQDSAAPDVRALSDRLGEFMMVSCRRPTGVHDLSFKDPARATHLLDRYWRPASSLLHAQMKIHVGYSPHPLTRIIENLRDRIAWCFELLKDRPDAARVAEEADGLLSMLSEGDVDDLTAVEEWATPAIRRVELFIARAGMALGAWHGTMTQAESFFLSHIEPLVAEHTRDVSARWKRIVARADAAGAARSQAVSQQQTPTGRGPEPAREPANPPPPVGTPTPSGSSPLSQEEANSAASSTSSAGANKAESDGWLRLKAMERDILVAMREHKATSIDASPLPSQSDVAKWAGYGCDATLKSAMSSLVKAQYIDNGKYHGLRGGYFLLPLGIRAADFFQQS